MIFIDPTLEPAKRKEQLGNLIQMLDSLFKHPGYQMLDEYYKREEEGAFDTLTKCTTGDIAMKASGAYITIKKMREVPHNYLRISIEELKKI